jgi:hypothetical protein
MANYRRASRRFRPAQTRRPRPESHAGEPRRAWDERPAGGGDRLHPYQRTSCLVPRCGTSPAAFAPRSPRISTMHDEEMHPGVRTLAFAAEARSWQRHKQRNAADDTWLRGNTAPPSRPNTSTSGVTRLRRNPSASRWSQGAGQRWRPTDHAGLKRPDGTPGQHRHRGLMMPEQTVHAQIARSCWCTDPCSDHRLDPEQ